MRAFYDGPCGTRYLLTPEKIHERKIELAIIRTGSGDFRRIRILRLEEDEEWERREDDCDHRIELLGRELEPDDDYSHRICCGASGSTERRSPSNGNEISEETSFVLDQYAASDPRFVLADENVNLPLNSSEIEWFSMLGRFCGLPFRVSSGWTLLFLKIILIKLCLFHV